MQHRFAVYVLLLGSSLGAAACSKDVTTAPTTTTMVNEPPFTGTLTKNGAATYAFASAPGTVTATLTTLAPDSTLVVGISMGTWKGNACQIVLARDNATQGTVVVGNAASVGNLCVRIYDVGLVVQPESYQIDIVHF
jgi:hypothetical protein